LRELLAAAPAFRWKGIGAPGSEERAKQERHIAAEDSARVVLAPESTSSLTPRPEQFGMSLAPEAYDAADKGSGGKAASARLDGGERPTQSSYEIGADYAMARDAVDRADSVPWHQVGDGAFASPFGTIRRCRGCGCL